MFSFFVYSDPHRVEVPVRYRDVQSQPPGRRRRARAGGPERGDAALLRVILDAGAPQRSSDGQRSSHTARAKRWPTKRCEGSGPAPVDSSCLPGSALEAPYSTSIYWLATARYSARTARHVVSLRYRCSPGARPTSGSDISVRRAACDAQRPSKLALVGEHKCLPPLPTLCVEKLTLRISGTVDQRCDRMQEN